jgi:glutamyl-tRNA reductase
MRAGRRVQSETFVSRHDRSVAAAAVRLAHSLLGDIKRRRALVVGTGDAGTTAIRALVQNGARDVVIANRTHRRAVDVATRLRVRAVSLAKLPEALRDADLVICASSSTTPMISRRTLLESTAVRDGPPVVLIDMSVPRNIDPSVHDVPGIRLFDMDDLRTMCPAGPEEREREMARAAAILEEEIQRFGAWWRSLRAVPTISALLANVEQQRSIELAKTLRGLPSMAQEDRDRLDALTRAIVKKVLHQPITHLKGHSDDQDCLAAARALFGLEHDAEASSHANGHSHLSGQRPWSNASSPDKIPGRHSARPAY